AMVQWDTPANRSIGCGEDLLLDALQCTRDRDVNRTLSSELHLEHLRTSDVPFGLFRPRGVPEDDSRGIAVVKNGLELSAEEGVQGTRLPLHSTLCRLDLHVGIGQHVEQVTLVGALQGLLGVRAPRDG